MCAVRRELFYSVRACLCVWQIVVTKVIFTVQREDDLRHIIIEVMDTVESKLCHC